MDLGLLPEIYDLVLNYGFKIRVVTKHDNGNYILEAYKDASSKKYLLKPGAVCTSKQMFDFGDLIISRLVWNEKGNMRII